VPGIDITVLVAHGDADQIVPIAASALPIAELLPNATLKVFPGAPHGLVGAYEQAFNAELLEWAKG
jgi:non-heme chloroperoxidase